MTSSRGPVLLVIALGACGGASHPTAAPSSGTPCPAPAAAPSTAATAATPATPAPAPATPEAAPAGGAIRVSALPAPAYIEKSDGAQLVNCDFLIDNGTSNAWQLAEIQVSVRDGKGALSWRKLLNGNGVSPSILTIPNREVPAHQQILLLNPLFAFPRDLELAALHYELTFARDGSDDTLSATVDVAPIAYRDQVRLSLPVGGRLLVWDGHDFYSHHRRWDYVFAPIRAFGFDSNAARYSYDLIPVDAAGEMHKGDPARNESWFGFGQPVRAPGAGTVVAVVGDRPDDRQFDQGQLKADLLVVYGNHVILDHGHGEYSMLGHLKQGSPTVKVGDRVKAGQVIAAIGASGSSLMPHLHYQLQNRADGHAEGLPSYFHDFVRVRGSRSVRVVDGQIDSGDLVETPKH
jgi:murein DD-endopeptidase MepM/ murein hydrolase activator NlpD